MTTDPAKTADGSRVRRQAGNCDDCSMIHVIELHFETPLEEIPDQAEWESFSDCLVCGGDISWVEYHSRTSWEEGR